MELTNKEKQEFLRRELKVNAEVAYSIEVRSRAAKMLADKDQLEALTKDAERVVRIADFLQKEFDSLNESQTERITS